MSKSTRPHQSLIHHHLPFVDHTYCKMPNTTLYSQSKTLHDSLQTPAKPAFELHYTYRTALGVVNTFLFLFYPRDFRSPPTLKSLWIRLIWRPLIFESFLYLSSLSLSRLLWKCRTSSWRLTYLSNGLILPRMLNSSLKTHLCFCSVLGFCSLTSWIFITLMQSSFAFPFCFCIFVKYSESGWQLTCC